MRSLPSGWNRVLAKLGFTRNGRKKITSRGNFHRALRIESLENRRVLAAVTVSTVADVVDGNVSSISALISSPGADGKISLRESIAAANADTTADTISFDPLLDGAEILLNRSSGNLSVNSSLTIDASALTSLTVNADED